MTAWAWQWTQCWARASSETGGSGRRKGCRCDKARRRGHPRISKRDTRSDCHAWRLGRASGWTKDQKGRFLTSRISCYWRVRSKVPRSLRQHWKIRAVAKEQENIYPHADWWSCAPPRVQKNKDQSFRYSATPQKSKWCCAREQAVTMGHWKTISSW